MPLADGEIPIPEPEDILQASNELAGAFGFTEFMPSPAEYSAAFGLIVFEALKSDCACDVCVRLRETLTSFHGAMKDMHAAG